MGMVSNLNSFDIVNPPTGKKSNCSKSVYRLCNDECIFFFQYKIDIKRTVQHNAVIRKQYGNTSRMPF